MLFRSITAFMFIMGAVTIFSSCQKEQVRTGTTQYDRVVTSQEQRAAEELMEDLPNFAVYNEEENKLYTFDPKTRDFSFSTPNSDWNFSNQDGVEYVSNGNQGWVIIPVFNFGANSGGTIVAGNSVLDVDYTFCFSASEEALGLDLFGYGGDLTGVSVVVGIAGNFEALMDGDVDEDADFTDFFHGFAAYYVYANEAQGSYDILNWFDNVDEDVDTLAEQGFAYVIDWIGPGIYFSSDGTLNVSGGSITFNGEYLGITDFALDFEDDEDGFDFGYVSGFGTLGCN